jgi:hypothetical protein
MNSINPETMNIIWLFLAAAVGWIILRFILKLAKRIFTFGCFAIVILGAVLFFFQYLGGV